MFAYIINPRTNIKYKINSNEGINILKKYLNYLEDGHNEPCALNTKGTHCIKSKNWDKKYCKRALNKNKDYCKKTKTLVRKSKTYITPCSANQTEKDCVDQDNCTYNTRKGCIENTSDKDYPCKMYHNNPKICKRRNCIYSKNGYCRKRTTTKKTSSIRKDSKKTSPIRKLVKKTSPKKSARKQSPKKSNIYITPCSANQTEKDCVDQDNCTYNTRKGCIENTSDKDYPCKMYHNNPKICKRRNCIYSKNGYCRKRTTKKTSSIRKDSKKTSPKKKIANHSKRLSAKSYYNTYGLNSLNNKCNNKCLKLIGDKNIPKWIKGDCKKPCR